MYKTVKYSTELQYFIELGAQRLIPVHPRPPTVSTAECLRILRKKANGWASSFKLSMTRKLYDIPCKTTISSIITHQQLGLSFTGKFQVESKIIDLRTCTAETASTPPCKWNNDTLNTVPGTSVRSRHMDETQDLMITVNILNDNLHTSNFIYRLNFRTISTDKETSFSSRFPSTQ